MSFEELRMCKSRNGYYVLYRGLSVYCLAYTIMYRRQIFITFVWGEKEKEKIVPHMEEKVVQIFKGPSSNLDTAKDNYE